MVKIVLGTQNNILVYVLALIFFFSLNFLRLTRKHVTKRIEIEKEFKFVSFSYLEFLTRHYVLVFLIV